MVAIRIVVNPVSNVFQKRLAQQAADPLFIIAATHAWLTLLCAPILMFLPPLHLSVAFWLNMIVAAVLAVTGNSLLVHALKHSDLSVLGPVNAYKPVISLLLAVFLLGEVPRPMGFLGVLLILAGSYFVADRDTTRPRSNPLVQFFRARGVQLRFAALALAATEAVFLKKALMESSPLITLLFWSILGVPIAAFGLAMVHRERLGNEMKLLRRQWMTYAWLALTIGVMMDTTLFTFGKLPVGYSLALFQLSTLISVFLGWRYFQEKNIRKRLAGSVVMMAGAVLIMAAA